jgi:F-type H+-transporting ATPase subunit b
MAPATVLAASILAAETAPEEEHNILLPAFYDIFWGGICFLILLFVVWRYALPRIRQTLEERTAGIEGKLAKAERDRAQAESLLSQYREQLAEARSDAARIRAEAQSDRKAIVDAARGEAQEAARLEGERTQARLAADISQARQQLTREVGGMAVTLASRIVGDSLDESRTRSTVDRFLDELDAQVPADGEPAGVGAATSGSVAGSAVGSRSTGSAGSGGGTGSPESTSPGGSTGPGGSTESGGSTAADYRPGDS